MLLKFAAEPSVDPSSRITNSKSRRVWPRMLSTAAGRYGIALYTVIATLSSGIYVPLQLNEAFIATFQYRIIGEALCVNLLAR